MLVRVRNQCGINAAVRPVPSLAGASPIDLNQEEDRAMTKKTVIKLALAGEEEAREPLAVAQYCGTSISMIEKDYCGTLGLSYHQQQSLSDQTVIEPQRKFLNKNLVAGPGFEPKIFHETGKKAVTGMGRPKLLLLGLGE